MQAAPRSGRITLIGGGTRSGKSSFALRLARERASSRVYLATAKPVDDDMRARIQRHRDERPDFVTIEEPVELTAALEAITSDVVVIDCVTIWIANLMLAGLEDRSVLERVDALVRALTGARFESILVTNEVGMSVHAPTEMGRRFTDLCGLAHQRLSRAGDEVYVAIVGTVLRLRPSPVISV